METKPEELQDQAKKYDKAGRYELRRSGLTQRIIQFPPSRFQIYLLQHLRLYILFSHGEFRSYEKILLAVSVYRLHSNGRYYLEKVKRPRFSIQRKKT